MKTKLTLYDDLSQLDDEMLGRIVHHEREAYGYRPYGEYRFCSNKECRRILSIDDVFGASDTKESYKPLNELESNGCDDFDCPDCGSPTIVIFNPEIFKPILVDLYRNAYGSILTDDNDKVRGACVFQEYGMRDFFEGNLNYKDNMTWEEFRARARKALQRDFQEETPVVATNRISVERPFRKGGRTFMDLARSTYNIKPENDTHPAFASVRFDGNVLPYLEAMGYKQVYADEYGTVAIGTGSTGIPRAAFNLSPDEFQEKFGPEMQRLITNQRVDKVIQPAPKYYRGMAALDMLQKGFENLKQS